MNKNTTKEFICPKCKKHNKVSLNDNFYKDSIPKIIDRSIFQVECSYCHEHVYIEYPFNILGDNYFIYYTPTVNDSQKQIGDYITRVCDTYDDLKEKVLILEDNLNDIVIDFIKKFILEQLSSEDKIKVDGIRYDSMNENNLNFYLFGLQKKAMIPIKFYEDILARSKIKKIKKGIMVDEYTYHKYFKLV